MVRLPVNSLLTAYSVLLHVTQSAYIANQPVMLPRVHVLRHYSMTGFCSTFAQFRGVGPVVIRAQGILFYFYQSQNQGLTLPNVDYKIATSNQPERKHQPMKDYPASTDVLIDYSEENIAELEAIEDYE